MRFRNVQLWLALWCSPRSNAFASWNSSWNRCDGIPLPSQRIWPLAIPIKVASRTKTKEKTLIDAITQFNSMWYAQREPHIKSTRQWNFIRIEQAKLVKFYHTHTHTPFWTRIFFVRLHLFRRLVFEVLYHFFAYYKQFSLWIYWNDGVPCAPFNFYQLQFLTCISQVSLFDAV